jgi:hypothetical protein
VSCVAIKSTFPIAKSTAARAILETNCVGHLAIETFLTLAAMNNGHLEANIAIRKNRLSYNVTCSCKKHRQRREKMIENGLILTGNDAELLSRALSEVKAKVYEESETSLDDTQALDALLSSLRTVETEEREKETRHTYINPLRKRLVLGTMIDRQRGA